MNDILINFDAEKARLLHDAVKKDELSILLSSIHEIAVRGGNSMYVYTPYSIETINEIEKRGFKIVKSSSIDIQKSNLHYTIKW